MSKCEVLELPCVDSTNDEIKRQFKAGTSELIVVADTQTHGRGTHNRTWQSTPGGLYFSYGIKKPNIDQSVVAHLTSKVAACVINIVHELTGIQIQMEWPNDLILGIKKVGGILVECNSLASQSTPNYVIIGIGLNINQSHFDHPIANTATSLRLFSNEEVDLKAIFSKFTKEIPQCL